MQSGIEVFLVTIGHRTAAVIAAGGVLAFLGLGGFAVTILREPVPGRGRAGRIVLVLVSALLLVAGVSAHLIAGLYQPLGKVIARLDHQTDMTEFLTRSQSGLQVRALLNLPRYRDPKRLCRYEFKVFSQNGEDGIIAEIFRRIGTTNRSFVEFGSSDGNENNTAFLVRLGWSGLWIDADTAALARAREKFRAEVTKGDLVVIESFITAENIEDLFRQGKVPEEPDLLSIDIDRNDYHVWEKVTHYRPRVVVVEYNSRLPPDLSWVVPYDPKAYGGSVFGNGASLKALTELGAKKGYSLVGCNLSGVNSFFVRDDLLGDHFAAPYTAENHYEPTRYAYLNVHLNENGSLSPGPDAGARK